MVDAWIPGARCIRAQADGGTLRGGAPRVVWQALGADPRLISAHSAAQRLDQEGRPPHLVWNPLSGDIAQLIPVVRAGCLLGAPESLEYGRSEPGPSPAVAANRQGRLCVQVGVVAWAPEPVHRRPDVRRGAHPELAAVLGRAVALAGRPPGPVRAGPHYGAQPRPLGARRPLRRLTDSRLGRGRPGRHRHRPAGPGPGHPLPGHLPASQTQARDGQPESSGRAGDDAGGRDRRGRRRPLTWPTPPTEA